VAPEGETLLSRSMGGRAGGRQGAGGMAGGCMREPDDRLSRHGVCITASPLCGASRPRGRQSRNRCVPARGLEANAGRVSDIGNAAICDWVGLDSATNLEYVERPRDSAERGIGAHSSRIQRALGGLHSATRPIGVDFDS
jgi:hypothetical protein